MLRVLRQGQRWIVGGVVFIVGAVFVLFFGPWDFGAGQRSTFVVQVDDIRYGPKEVLRVRAQQEERYREALGENFDARRLGEQLDSAAASMLVTRGIMLKEAERSGLHVSDQEVERSIRSIPSFRDAEGRLDAEAARQNIEYEYGSVARFKEIVRADLLVRKMAGLVQASAHVSEQEAREAVLFRLEEVRLAYVGLDEKKLPADAEIPEGAAEETLRSEEEGMRALYEERREEFDRPERVRARHILVRVVQGATPEVEDSARARTEAILERVRGGEDFAKVAQEESDDPGTAAKGGDLGFFARGQMVPEFEQAAFSLEPGTLSGVIRSSFGFHILRVEERQAAELVPYEEVREELARDLVTQRLATERAVRLASELEQAVAAGSSLEAAARAAGLTLERTGWLRRRPDGFLPGLGASTELTAAAFSLTLEHPSLPRAFDVGERRVLIQLLERRLPDEETLAKEVPAERERLVEAERGRLQAEWVEAARSELLERGRITVDLAALNGP
jgi:peptidyl-prolyl cis-trans isomerase D